jgi:hypothetical protein
MIGLVEAMTIKVWENTHFTVAIGLLVGGALLHSSMASPLYIITIFTYINNKLIF